MNLYHNFISMRTGYTDIESKRQVKDKEIMSIYLHSKFISMISIRCTVIV